MSMSTINAYRVPPLHEFKARRELREAGCKAFLPTARLSKRNQPIARGYIFADHKPPDAKHVRSPIGPCPRAQLLRLYTRRDRGHEPASPVWTAGDRVEIKVGPFASMSGSLIRKRGRRQWIVDVAGKHICAQTQSLIRIDPG
jgi:hypothetical protein